MMESGECLQAPPKAVWGSVLNLLINLAMLLFAVTSLDLLLGSMLLITSLYNIVFMICVAILVGIMTNSFSKKCENVGETSKNHVYSQSVELLKEFAKIKKSCQLGLFIAFAHGTILTTYNSYFFYIMTFLPCLEEYKFLAAQISLFLQITNIVLSMYFYAVATDDCYQAFKGLLVPLR